MSPRRLAHPIHVLRRMQRVPEPCSVQAVPELARVDQTRDPLTDRDDPVQAGGVFEAGERFEA